MDRIKSALKNHSVMLYFFISILILHIGKATNISDDAVHATILTKQSIFERAYDLYFHINGKVFPDSFAAVFTYLPSVLWKLADSLVYVLIAYCIYTLFLKSNTNKESENRYKILACVATLFLSLELIVSAGYVAGSVNYIWTSAMLLTSFIPFKRYFSNQNLKKWEYLVYPLATMYACNQEQSMALLLTFHVLLICYGFLRKVKLKKYIYFQFLLSVACAFALFLSPGNQSRQGTFSIFSIPNFPMLNTLERFNLGITSTCSYFLGNFRNIFALTALLLLLNVWKKHKEWIPRLFGLVPFCWSVLLLFRETIFNRIPFLNELFASQPFRSYGLSDFAYLTADTYTNIRYYFPIVVSIIIIAAIIVDIMLIFDQTNDKLLYSLIFLGGFTSRVIMGFSRTLYGSGERTFTFFYLSLIILMVQLWRNFEREKQSNALLIVASAMAGMGWRLL